MVRGKSSLNLDKRLEKIRDRILQKDKRQRRMLLSIDLAIERITTGAAITDMAKRHNLNEEKVRRYIENAVLLARSRMFEKPANKPKAASHPGDSNSSAFQ